MTTHQRSAPHAIMPRLAEYQRDCAARLGLPEHTASDVRAVVWLLATIACACGAEGHLLFSALMCALCWNTSYVLSVRSALLRAKLARLL